MKKGGFSLLGIVALFLSLIISVPLKWDELNN